MPGNHIIHASHHLAIEIPNKVEVYQLKGGTPLLFGAFPSKNRKFFRCDYESSMQKMRSWSFIQPNCRDLTIAKNVLILTESRTPSIICVLSTYRHNLKFKSYSSFTKNTLSHPNIHLTALRHFPIQGEGGGSFGMQSCSPFGAG